MQFSENGEDSLKPKISVIMGIYNCQNTLAEAIDSILDQTYTSWKVIMCDDGSTDNTYGVAESYRDRYPDRIVLIKNYENIGLNRTLNHCLEFADTEYVARMDGDDISLPDRFEKEVSFLEKHPEYVIVSTPMIYFDEKGEFGRGVGLGEPSRKAFAKGTPFCHAPCMVRKDAYERVHGYTESKHRLRVEDWDLWVRMYEQGYRGYVLEKPLYKMRDDRNAYSRRQFKYRINEARVSASAVKKLKLSPIMYVWVLRPIVVGLLPQYVYNTLHKRRMRQ